jgi:cardiolipin synthase
MLYHHSRKLNKRSPAGQSARATFATTDMARCVSPGDCTGVVTRLSNLRVETLMSDVPSLRLNPFRNAPNLLTLARICLAPFLVSAILDRQFTLSFYLFVAAGLTDALDGTLARLLKQRTTLGEYLDPVADKLLLSTLFLVLMHMGLIPVRVTVMVFGRDVGILVVAAILYAAAGRREFTPSIFGKANTLAQVAAVAAVLLNQLTAARWVAEVRMAALGSTMVLTVVSGLHYAWLVSRRVVAPALGSNGAR